MSALYLSAGLCVTTVLYAQTPGPEFFRVGVFPAAIPVEPTLTPDGTLTWSNTTIPVEYVIESTSSLWNAAWEPVTRGDATNHTHSVKVVHPSPPAGMVFIPGGRFTMGDVLGDHSNASPAHGVRVSPFFMQTHEVTLAQVARLFQWGLTNNLITVVGDYVQGMQGTNLYRLNRYNSEIYFLNGHFFVKAGRDSFPSPYVSWFGAVTLCNLASRIHGKEECYNLQTWECDFGKNGFRLPTEAEWELAARGGYEGRRFPWGDTNVITHSRANYKSSTNNVYDVSPTLGLHPDYAANKPSSSPVGTFPPNNYRLNDMCGNVWEWVWDWSARYSSLYQEDPTGPSSGRFRVFRGGSWYTTAERVTCAARYTSAGPEAMIEDVGFRMVIPFRSQ